MRGVTDSLDAGLVVIARDDIAAFDIGQGLINERIGQRKILKLFGSARFYTFVNELPGEKEISCARQQRSAMPLFRGKSDIHSGKLTTNWRKFAWSSLKL